MYTALDTKRKFSFLCVTNIVTRNQCALFKNMLFHAHMTAHTLNFLINSYRHVN